MKFPGFDYKLLVSGFSMKETLITILILFLGMILTAVSVFYTRQNLKKAARQDFEFACGALTTRIDTRLDEHAQLLSSGEAFFSVSDTVTMDQWHDFYLKTRVNTYLPGIQGFGFSMIIPEEQLPEHIRFFRSHGFPDYKITPEYDREIYTATIIS